MTLSHRTVLVIDGDRENDGIYERLLEQDATASYRVYRQLYHDLVLEPLHSCQFDGILLEACVQDQHCLELLSSLHHRLGDACPPVVMVGDGDIQLAVDALKAGAADYLIRDRLTADALCLSIRTAIENAELKRALKQSQEQFQTSVENMMDCFGIFTAMRDEAGQITDFRIDYLNAAACENNRMSRAEQIGRGLCEVLPGHRESGLFDEYCQVVESGEPLIKDSLMYDDTYGEHYLVRAFDIRAKKLGDGFVASWRDSTDRKRTEVALQAKIQEAEAGRQTLEALMAYLPEGITIADAPDVTIRQVSRYGQQLAGQSAATLEGLSVDDHVSVWNIFCADGVTPATNEALPLTRAVQQGEVVVDEEWVVQRPDGQKVFIACNAGPIYDADGNITGGVIAWHDISHRKSLEWALARTTTALQRQQNQLKQLIDRAPIGIGIGIQDGTVTLINDEMLRLHGYTREEFDQQGLNWRDFLSPEATAPTDQFLAQLQECGFVPPVERELRHRDGTRVPIWISASQGLDDSNEHIAFAIDLTAQKTVEAAFRASERNVRRVIDSLFSFVGVLTPNGILIEANQTALDAAALSPADVLGQPFEQTYWWSYSPAVQAQLRDAIHCAAQGETVRYEVLVRLQPNQFVTIDFALVPLFNAAGQVEYLIPSGIDITERVRVEASLRQSQAQLQQQLAEIEALYRSAPIGLAVLDRELRFVRINEQLAEINGASVEDHLGRTVRELLPDLADAAERLLTPIFATGEPLLNIEIEGETPANPGVKRVWRENFLPLKDGDRVVGISIVCEEITKRKQAEIEREEMLQREQEAREAAERANRLKDEFLAILSHELRTPLNPILGWTRLLKTRRLDAPKIEQALDTIERNAKLLTQLIDDLLDVARILRGKLKLNTAAIDPAGVIRAAVETIQPAANAKAVALNINLQAVGLIEADPVRLQQIVWNILSNAIKFTPPNGQVDIQLLQVDQTARIVITDTGIGIHPNFLPHIFESFRQEDTSVTREFGGLGLGLAIVRYLVAAQGGTVTATSPGEGQGATFTVNLPLLPDAPQAVPPADRSSATLNLRGVRVMIVDDMPDSLELLAILLKQYGAEVQSFPSAIAALAAFVDYQPGLLISDIGMPDMDGYALIQQIRALPPEQGGQVPAIAVTAYARPEDQERALRHGFQAHIAKPIESSELGNVIARLLMPH